jgi:hypothetical protein
MPLAGLFVTEERCHCGWSSARAARERSWALGATELEVAVVSSLDFEMKLADFPDTRLEARQQERTKYREFTPDEFKGQRF